MTDLLMIQLLFIGTTELLLIGGMALLLFGGKKLPEMMRGLGQGVKEFKKGMNEMKTPDEEQADENQTKTANHKDKEVTPKTTEDERQGEK